MTLPKTWTIWHHAQLRDLAAKGFSASQIGNTIGKSKNSIIGMARRKKIKLSGSNGSRKPDYTENTDFPQNPAVESLTMPEATKLPKIRFDAPNQRKQAPPSKAITLLERTSDQCGWIIGEVVTNSRICGEPVIEGSSYCANHHSICHHHYPVKQIDAV
jgi:hypothetical protein